MRMLQDEAEIARFADILAAEGARSYLEIGSKFGGSLQRIAAALPPGSRIISVDKPTPEKPAANLSLRAVIGDLRSAGYDAGLVADDSGDPMTVALVRMLGPFDAVLIDADHRLPAVERDWENYGTVGRIIAFHDIAWRRVPEWQGTRIDVPQVWDRVKRDFRYEEIRLCPTGKNNGIGVLWRS